VIRDNDHTRPGTRKENQRQGRNISQDYAPVIRDNDHTRPETGKENQRQGEDCQLEIMMKVLIAVSLFSGCYFLSEAASKGCDVTMKGTINIDMSKYTRTNIGFLYHTKDLTDDLIQRNFKIANITKDHMKWSVTNNECPDDAPYCDGKLCQKLGTDGDDCGDGVAPCGSRLACLHGTCKATSVLKRRTCPDPDSCPSFMSGTCTPDTALCVERTKDEVLCLSDEDCSRGVGGACHRTPGKWTCHLNVPKLPISPIGAIGKLGFFLR